VRSIAEILNATHQLPDSQHRHFTGIIVKESERLTRLINQVLDFQRLETGKMSWQMQPVDLREVCREALRAVRPLIDDRHIELSFDLPHQAPLIRGDRDRLVQTVLNLLSNAVKFCASSDGRIVFRLAVHPYHLQVDVSDNGVGIRPEDLKIIFEEFRQARNAPMGRPAGSGLGLAITRRIVAYHGGRIWAESQPHEGSTLRPLNNCCFQAKTLRNPLYLLNANFGKARNSKVSRSPSPSPFSIRRPSLETVVSTSGGHGRFFGRPRAPA
jgi:signal transduction histidine kinase